MYTTVSSHNESPEFAEDKRGRSVFSLRATVPILLVEYLLAVYKRAGYNKSIAVSCFRSFIPRNNGFR